MKLSLPAWIEALLFAGAILIYISGECGWILLYILSLAIILSIVTLALSRRNYTLSCSGCSGLYHVGDEVTAELVFTASGFCVLPHIIVSGVFMGQQFTARGSLIGKTGRIRIKLRASECGLNRMDIRSVVLRDFLGIVYLDSPMRPECAEAAVLPRVVNYEGPEVPPSLLPSDDDEESTQSLLTGGLPGYEHREYVPGDPLRRINYKLSVKKRALMVRKDENIAAESTDIILAPGSDGSCAEQAFALAGKLTAAGGTARIICGTESFTAGFATLARLREWLAFRDLSAIGAPDARRSAAVMRTVVTISPDGITVN